jgi:hypothetical protein
MTCPFSICQLRLWLFNIAFLQICTAAIYAKYCSQNLFFVSKLASCWSWSRQYFFSLPKAWMEMEFWHWIVLLTLYLPSLVSGLWFCKNWTFFCSILSNYKKIGAVMWAPWNKLKFLYWHPKYQWNCLVPKKSPCNFLYCENSLAFASGCDTYEVPAVISIG